MGIKNKILLAMIPLILLSVILSNIAFWLFSKDYIQQQEDVQVNTASESVSNYITEKIENYLGRVNDWAHWDDTYSFINAQNPDYAELNLSQSTFDNLDLSFMLFIDQAGQECQRLYYSQESESFVPFPASFIANMANVLTYASQDSDVSFLKKIGDDYYFLAASEVTDSTSESLPIGQLIIGRIIDANTLLTIESISGTKITEITAVDPFDPSKQNEKPTFMNTTVQKSKSSINIELVLSNPVSAQEAVQFNLTLSRGLYLSSMQRLLVFTYINILVCTALAVIFTVILGRVITKPFVQLVSEVGRIDTESGSYARVSESGGREIASLGKSINHLLGRIESGQRELSDNKKKLEATLVSVGDGVLAVDVEQNIVFMNPVAQKLTGWSFDEVRHAPIGNVFRIINEFTKEPVASPILQVFERGEIVELANHTLLITKNGAELPIEDTAAPIMDETGAVTGCVLVFRDSSERKERQRRIEYLSYHDQLTELYNRRFFEEELRRLDVERNFPLSIIYADVNGLKVINDAFGHESGDQLITLVAEAMRTVCRADDIIARVGGDEFVILLPKTDAVQAFGVIERVKESIRCLQINGIGASVSFGLDTKTEVAQTTGDVLNNAERNMYQEKIQTASSYRSGIMRGVFNALIQKLPHEKDHSIRVGILCGLIAKACDLSPADINELRIAGELHDIGKVSLSTELLGKSLPLNGSEWIQMKKHPETGYRLLGTCSEYYAIADIVLAHHERIDGKGYPRGLKGDDMNWKSKIVAVAEAFDSMVHDQPYRTALSRSAAVLELQQYAGMQFDPKIVEVFIRKVVDSLPASL